MKYKNFSLNHKINGQVIRTHSVTCEVSSDNVSYYTNNIPRNCPLEDL